MSVTKRRMDERKAKREKPMTVASPKKLRSGEWGAVADGAVREGDVVTVRTKAGKEWTAVVSKVIWTDGVSSIFATEKKSGGVKRRVASGYRPNSYYRGDGAYSTT